MQQEYRIFLPHEIQNKVFPLVPYYNNQLGFYIDILDDIIQFVKKYELLIGYGEIFRKIDDKNFDYDPTGFTHWEYNYKPENEYKKSVSEAIEQMKEYLKFISATRHDKYLISIRLYDKYSIQNLIND